MIKKWYQHSVFILDSEVKTVQWLHLHSRAEDFDWQFLAIS